MSTCSGRLASTRHLYRAVAEPGKLLSCVCLSWVLVPLPLCTFMPVVRYGCAVYVLVSSEGAGVNDDNDDPG